MEELGGASNIIQAMIMGLLSVWFMRHTDRHRALLVGLVLGELSDSEVNEAARLLEQCPRCRVDLEKYRDSFSPASIADRNEKISDPVYLRLVLRGNKEDIEAEISVLKQIAGPTTVELYFEVLSSGASDYIQRGIVIFASRALSTQVVEVVNEYLISRRTDFRRRERTQLLLGSVRLVEEERIDVTNLNPFLHPSQTAAKKE